MKIEHLFSKPIKRPINGVIKAEQIDDESVWQELEEFVVTRELDVHLRKFFETYLHAIRHPNDPAVAGQNGVWMSGFFGSGKSHFLKILSYLLENKEVRKGGESRRAFDFFQDRIQDAMLAADIKKAVQADTDVILFNIDTKADNSDGRDVILRVFLKVFNERLGFSGDYPHIAHMERYLAQQGKYEDFKTAFQAESGAYWLDERDAYHFHLDALGKALSTTVGQDIKDAEAWMEKMEEDFTPSIENFAKWVKEYLDSKGKGHRIVFLVDEVGQFIGQETPLMLNLQTIAENLGTVCGGRAWIIVTSQEDIDAVLGELRASQANDFSKIQGRFTTRLSLSGANADEVIQKRLLAKQDSAKAELDKVYASKADILKNQLSFKDVGMTFKAYADKEDFVSVYPFVPYQFQLVQKIFEASRRYGATGAHLAKGERSMLDAFQTAAVEIADEEIGVLSPLYRFYPAIESFLEGVVRAAIKNVDTNPNLEDFDSLVLKTLFLIRYIDEITGNVDNLVTLFIDRIDADRLALRNDIEASLQRLEKETLVGRNGDDFFFLTNEERDISREIKQVDLSTADETRLLGELLFDDLLGSLRKYRYPINDKDFGITKICDSHPYGNKADGDLVVSVITPLSEQHADFNEHKCLSQSTMDDGQVVIKLDDDKQLARELRAYLQTEKYISRKRDGTTTHTTNKILLERADENRQRRARLGAILERLMTEAKYYAAGQVREPSSGNAKDAVEGALEYLVQNTFPKLSSLSHPAANPQNEIKAVLNAPPVPGLPLGDGVVNGEALREVAQYVGLMASQNHKVVLYDLVTGRFGRRPYGWPDWNVVLLVAQLVMRGEVSLVGSGGILRPDQISAAIDGPNKWRNITVVKRQTVDQSKLQKARDVAKDVFDKIAPDGEDSLAAHLRDRLGDWQADLNGWKPLADTGNYPGRTDIADALGVVAKSLAINDSYQLITHFTDMKDDFLELSESVGDLRTFYNTQRPTWDKLRKAQGQFGLNRKELEKDPDADTALSRIDEILKAPAPYGMLKDADSLINKIDTINETLVQKRRDHALERMEGHIAKVQAELDDVGATPQLRNESLMPLQRTKSDIESQTSIAHIYQLQTIAQDQVDDAFSLIEAASVAPPADPVDGTDEGAAGGLGDGAGATGSTVEMKPAKKRRVIKPVSLAGPDFLETQDQVDSFLGKLRDELESAISNDERIEIQ